jgi:hypothetical protein
VYEAYEEEFLKTKGRHVVGKWIDPKNMAVKELDRMFQNPDLSNKILHELDDYLEKHQDFEAYTYPKAALEMYHEKFLKEKREPKA